MSLAIYAAPFDEEPNTIRQNDNIVNRKKVSNSNNKTQKRYTPFQPKPGMNSNEPSEKVLSVLQSIHNSPPTSSNGDLGDFNPLPPPNSAGVERMEGYTSMSSENGEESGASNTNNTGKYTPFSGMKSDENPDFYERFIPNYEEMYKASPSPPQINLPSPPQQRYNMRNGSGMDTNSALMEKLNYMIHLLEEQQDERTSNVTEEVVLYSFLGIFIIFIVDSFVRVGKYTR